MPRKASAKRKEAPKKVESTESNVTALPLPATQTIPLPEGVRWKAKAFQEAVAGAQARVKAAAAELQLRQAELQNTQRDLRNAVEEIQEALEQEVPEGYSLEELNPQEGVALCKLIPKE